MDFQHLNSPDAHPPGSVRKVGSQVASEAKHVFCKLLFETNQPNSFVSPSWADQTRRSEANALPLPKSAVEGHLKLDGVSFRYADKDLLGVGDLLAPSTQRYYGDHRDQNPGLGLERQGPSVNDRQLLSIFPLG